MKISNTVFSLFFLLAATSFAGLTDNQVDIKTSKEKFSVTTKKGFHLNAEAPASMVLDKTKKTPPNVKTEKLFEFNRDAEGEKNLETVKLNFYVCDDKKTVCEPHNTEVNLKNLQLKKTENKSEYSNLEEFKLKSNNGKSTLLVFSAPWCPPCIRMQTETYGKPEVKKQTAKLNFVKLNSDATENYELSQKFKVKAIPTLILLDKDGQETYRWLDFQGPKDFAQSLGAELNKVDQAALIIQNAQLGDVAAASALAHKAYNALDFAEAYKWFSLTKSEKYLKYKLASEVSLSKEQAEADAKTVDDYLQTLQKALALTTSELDQIRWSLDFFEKKQELKSMTEETKLKALSLVSKLDRLLKNFKLAEKSFLDSTYGNYSGFEKAELLWMKSRLYKMLEMNSQKDKTDTEARALIAKKNLSDSRPGEMLTAISYLREAGETKKVDDLYNQLIKKYSSSYVYFEKYARFVKKNKQFDKALKLTEEALKFPQGNEPQLYLLKSQILQDLNKKPEALATINETIKIENINHKRFASTLKRLTELKAELSK